MNRSSDTLLLQRWIYVLVKVGGDFLLAQTDRGRRAIAASGEYEPDFPEFLRRFLERLHGDDWPAGSYFPGGFHRYCRRTGGDPDEALRDRDNLMPFYIEETLVDEEGRWFVGKKPLKGRILRFFQHHLEFDPDPGRYRIRYPLEGGFDVSYLHHKSPPIRIVRVLPAPNGLELVLNTGDRDWLDPATLRMDRNENLYCAVGPHRLAAWFLPDARWEVLKRADERDGGWVLHTGQGPAPLQLDAGWPFRESPPAAPARPAQG